jgi:hypothetical protein
MSEYDRLKAQKDRMVVAERERIIEEAYPFAPSPFGGQYGPAAIRPRREDPLLAGELVRLLERHGVGWDQAVRESAGLMCQTVEETEGWWAFETCDGDSPVDAEMITKKRQDSGARRPVTINVQYSGQFDADTDGLIDHMVGSQPISDGRNVTDNTRQLEYEVSSVESAKRIRKKLLGRLAHLRVEIADETGTLLTLLRDGGRNG